MKSVILEQNTQLNLGQVQLPYSKSLSNRALIIRELCREKLNVLNLSDSDDTQNLLRVLQDHHPIKNVGAAGTNMRFLISLYSILPGVRTLTGTDRMLQRPIAELVQGLQSLGAQIRYAQKTGYPPVEITGRDLPGGKVAVNGSISSQYISSLLMIAPCLSQGLHIQILGPPVSKPYIEMTLHLMEYFGIQHRWQADSISIGPQAYKPIDYAVEADWSAAAFWYGLVATSAVGTQLTLSNLSKKSLQGDKKAEAYFLPLGVKTWESSRGLTLQKTEVPTQPVEMNLVNEPDLFIPLAFTCAGLRLKAQFTGLQTLNLKESKRIETTRTELVKTGAEVEAGEDCFNLTGYSNLPAEVEFNTHADHRLAMAASIFGQTGMRVSIHDPGVVTKSYPQFWKDLKNIRIANIY
jgi:3-phosphoshikimate 1-carboxyvinyltransferase